MSRTFRRKSYKVTWHSAGEGRYWKRLLSKVRRKAWKHEDHQRSLPSMESNVNYKNW